MMNGRLRGTSALRATIVTVGICVAAGVAAQPALSTPAANGAALATSPRLATDKNDLDLLLERFDAEERRLTDERDAIGPELEVTRQRVIARGRQYYRRVRAGLLPAGGGFDALVDHATEMERLRMALSRDLDSERALVRRHDELGATLEKLRAERAPYEVHRRAMSEARDALRQAEERRSAFQRAFEASSEPPDYVTVYGGDLGPDDEDRSSTAFAGRKGRLPLPVVGRAEVRRVSRPMAGGPGLELTAPAGALARTVAPGRVVFADRLDDYGLTVLVDHGEHYYSLYANLKELDVAVGDVLPAGKRLATVFSANGQSLLYFELRLGRDLVDPAPWLGLG
jgi:murein DD-endopeptidase MepM/ murein hydrolase activator NlpD